MVAVVAAMSACDPAPKPPVNTPPVGSPSPTASPAASPTGSPVSTAPGSDKTDDKKASKVDAWAGKWTGVEGTYLNITKKGDKYTIEIADLDGPKTYEGTAKGDTIEFTRKGKTETIKAATGAETGMKYLEKETNCLVVTKGSEGFCRKQ